MSNCNTFSEQKCVGSPHCEHSHLKILRARCWIPCLHSCHLFLISSPSYKTVSCSSSDKTKTEQKPSGNTAPALSWKTSHGTRGLPRLHPATGRPLSRSDRTDWCWHRNMKRFSLQALWLSAPVWTGCGLSWLQYQTSAWRLNAAKRKAFWLIH